MATGPKRVSGRPTVENSLMQMLRQGYNPLDPPAYICQVMTPQQQQPTWCLESHPSAHFLLPVEVLCCRSHVRRPRTRCNSHVCRIDGHGPLCSVRSCGRACTVSVGPCLSRFRTRKKLLQRQPPLPRPKLFLLDATILRHFGRVSQRKSLCARWGLPMCTRSSTASTNFAAHSLPKC